MVKESEIIILILSVFLIVIFYFIFRNTGVRIPRYINISLIIYISALLFAIIEGYFGSIIFNHLEHICYMFTAIFFYHGLRGFIIKIKSDN